MMRSALQEAVSNDPDEALEAAVQALREHDLDEWELRLVQRRYQFQFQRYRESLRILLKHTDLPIHARIVIEELLSVKP